MKVKVFIKNTVLLVLTSLILRGAGIVFRIYLADEIGSEGIGLYQLIFSVYMLASTFASTGVSTAVTRLVAENMQKGKKSVDKILINAVVITLAVGILSALAVNIFAPNIALWWIKDSAAVTALKILSFSLPFMGVSSCLRGYFIARRRTLEPSSAQLIEQAVRMSVIIIALKKAAYKDVAEAAAIVLFGDTVAEITSCLVSALLFFADRKRLKGQGTVANIKREILRISTPLAGAGYLSTTLHTVENLLVPTRLSLFYGTRSRGLEFYGAIRGMAMPILFFPASFLSSLSTLLIPEVSEASAEGKSREVVSMSKMSLKTTISLSVFVAAAFWFWGNDIAMLIYGEADVGYIIKVLSVVVPFMYLESVAAGILKGLDQQKSMFGYNLFDSLVRISAVYLFLPVFGINGYLGIMIISNCLTSSLCCRKLLKQTGLKIDIKNWIIIPLLVSGLSGVGFVWLFSFINNRILRLSLGLCFQTACFLIFYLKRERRKVYRIS